MLCPATMRKSHHRKVPELHQLEAFSAVMSAGSVTGAGELLGRSQPAVTRQIQGFEADLGYALFDRHGPRVTPTRRAFLLYEEVERSLVGLRAIEARARALGDESAIRAHRRDTFARGHARAGRARRASTARRRPTTSCAANRPSMSCTRCWPARPMSVSSRCRWRTRSLDALDRADAVRPCCRPATRSRRSRASRCATARRRIVTVANRHRLRQRIDAVSRPRAVDARVFIETNASLNAVMAARAGIGIGIVDPATGVALPVEGVVAPARRRHPVRVRRRDARRQRTHVSGRCAARRAAPYDARTARRRDLPRRRRARRAAARRPAARRARAAWGNPHDACTPDPPGGRMTTTDPLQALEARLAQDLCWLDLPAPSWVPRAREADGTRVLDVAIVGGGMASLRRRPNCACSASTTSA